MNNTSIPAENFTPNAGLVSDPAKRRVIQQALSAVGILLGTAIIVDATSTAFDITAFTGPIAAGYGYVVATFGFGSTVPNIPKP